MMQEKDGGITKRGELGGYVNGTSSPLTPLLGLATLLAFLLSIRGNSDITARKGWAGSHTSNADTGGDNCLGNRCHHAARGVSINSTLLSSQETDDFAVLYFHQMVFTLLGGDNPRTDIKSV